MARTGFKKTGKWAQMKKALNPKLFTAASRKHIRRANKINGLLAERSIRQVINKGDFKPNAQLTAEIKGSTRPLIDTGDMRAAVTSKTVDDFTVFAGVLRTNENYNVAVTVHEGTEIEVTPKMRTMFWALWLKSRFRPDLVLSGRAAELWDRFKGPWRRLTGDVIVIPSRPFIRYGFADPELHRLTQRNWERAIQAAIRELAS